MDRISITVEHIEDIAGRTGMPAWQVFRMLEAGWIYIEEIGRPIRWELGQIQSNTKIRISNVD